MRPCQKTTGTGGWLWGERYRVVGLGPVAYRLIIYHVTVAVDDVTVTVDDVSGCGDNIFCSLSSAQL